MSMGVPPVPGKGAPPLDADVDPPPLLGVPPLLEARLMPELPVLHAIAWNATATVATARVRPRKTAKENGPMERRRGTIVWDNGARVVRAGTIECVRGPRGPLPVRAREAKDGSRRRVVKMRAWYRRGA